LLVGLILMLLVGACGGNAGDGPSLLDDVRVPWGDGSAADSAGRIDSAGSGDGAGGRGDGGDRLPDGAGLDQSGLDGVDTGTADGATGLDSVQPPPDSEQQQDVVGPQDDVASPDVVDSKPEDVAPPCPTPLCDGVCCKDGEQCLAKSCLPCLAACGDGVTCQNDSYCLNGCCVPWGMGPKGAADWGCQKVLPPGVFRPALQCEWNGYDAGTPNPAHRQVLGTPVVFPIDPKQGSIMVPWIFFVGYGGLDGGFAASSSNGYIRVLDGKECKLLYTLDMASVVGACPLAVGDLDGDDEFLPEVVACREGGGLVAFKFAAKEEAWKLLWTSTEKDGSTSAFAAGEHRWNGPTIVDLDGQGGPEILFGGEVFSSQGVRFGTSLGWKSFGSTGQFSLAVDVDQDASPELVMGDGIWGWSGSDWKPEPYFVQPGADGYVAVADFGDFPVAGLPPTIPEVAVVSPGWIRVMRIDGTTVFGPYPLAGGGSGGPPTVGDFDNDGVPEVALASMGAYQVFDLECAVDPLPAFCEAPGRRWSEVSQDFSSNITGSSVFDFEGDGKAEGVYADECFLRVYEGSNGEVLYSRPRSSCTWNENPVIADVDGDYRSEILVGSNENCDIACPSVDPVFKGLRCLKDSDCAAMPCVEGFCRCQASEECGAVDVGLVCTVPLAGTPGTGNVCRAAHSGKTSGIRVFRDSSDHWVQSRKLWNQHVYYVTNINDSGTVPSAGTELLNWLTPGLNNFRQNTQGVANPLSAPDAALDPEGYSCIDGLVTLEVELCNRGAAPLAADTPVAFYLGQPMVESVPLCMVVSTEPLPPGKCQVLACTASGPVVGPAMVFGVADDGGDLAGDTTECVEDNNLAVFEGVICPQP
jgi:hypothetical protein